MKNENSTHRKYQDKQKQESQMPDGKTIPTDKATHSDDDIPLKHFMSRKHFLEMIRTGQNTLMHISRWKDVNEGVIYRSRVEVKDGSGRYQNSPYFFINLYKDYFGQCWSKVKYASEILWHARCPTGDGVCIQTTVGKLRNSLDAVSNSAAYVSQAVKYNGITWFMQLFKKLRMSAFANQFTSNFNEIVELLFHKRKEFSDEKEFRILVFAPQNGSFQYGPGWIKYPLAKSDFLTKVILDPRMKQCCVDSIKNEVLASGWACNGKPLMIEKSPLYKPMRGVIRVG